jgi:hypothetical protein
VFGSIENPFHRVPILGVDAYPFSLCFVTFTISECSSFSGDSGPDFVRRAEGEETSFFKEVVPRDPDGASRQAVPGIDLFPLISQISFGGSSAI